MNNVQNTGDTHRVFDYENEKHGFPARYATFTHLPQYGNISSNGFLDKIRRFAKCGFRQVDENSGKIKCDFCNTEIHAKTITEDIFDIHLNSSPSCILMQSECNFRIKNQHFISSAQRHNSFRHHRFQRLRRGYNPRNVSRTIDLLVNSGFYFASQVNVFDQVKCFFCDVSFECFLFSETLTQEQVHNLHAHKSRNCTFLIDKLGAIEFQNLLRQPRVRVRQAPAIEPPARAGQNSGPRPPDQPPTPLIEESDIDNSAEPHLSQRFNELRTRMVCNNCNQNRATVIIEPCLHLSLCTGCENLVQNCPTCQTPIISKYSGIFG